MNYIKTNAVLLNWVCESSENQAIWFSAWDSDNMGSVDVREGELIVCEDVFFMNIFHNINFS